MSDIDAYRGYIEGALAFCSGTHLYEDIVAAVEAGTLQFWPGPNSVIITEILTTPRRKILHFFLAGGNLSELEVMIAPIEAWGRAQGCDGASSTARRSWSRTFLTKNAGWSATRMEVFTKDLNDGTR